MQFHRSEHDFVALGKSTRPPRGGTFRSLKDKFLELLLRDRSHPSATWWPELLGAVLAIGGVVAASLQAFHVREWQDSGSDFKTVYASGKNFLHGLPAYSIDGVARVFHQYGVVTPVQWYAHAPVYPPFTFAALAPVIALPVVPAVYVWMAVSALALVLSLWALGMTAQRQYGLGRIWRLLLITAVAASPLVSLGLQVGNVSMVAAPLCVCAAAAVARENRRWRVLALTVSFLLKPHISLWVIVGLLLMPKREDRKVALWSAAWIGAALLCFAAVFHRELLPQMHGLSRMLHDEVTTGSLNPHNRDALVIFVQITSVQLLLGYWMGGDHWLNIVSYASLAVLGVALLSLSRLSSRTGQEGSRNDRLEMLTAWSAFGLVVTYHRTPDAVVLFLLLPTLLYRLRRQWTDGMAWAILVTMQLTAWGPSIETLNDLAREPRWAAVADFLRFRQGSCAMVLLVVLLIVDLFRQRWLHRAERRLDPGAFEDAIERASVAEPEFA